MTSLVLCSSELFNLNLWQHLARGLLTKGRSRGLSLQVHACGGDGKFLYVKGRPCTFNTSATASPL